MVNATETEYSIAIIDDLRATREKKQVLDRDSSDCLFKKATKTLQEAMGKLEEEQPKEEKTSPKAKVAKEAPPPPTPALAKSFLGDNDV